MWQTEIPQGAKALGYKKLLEIFNLKDIPHFCWSYASPKWEKRKLYFNEQNLILNIYPPSYLLSDNIFDHLEFAIKHEGINFLILKQVLLKISPSEVTKYINQKTTGKFARIIWYLYEKFNNKELPLPSLEKGTYVPLLDPKVYFCGKSIRHPRQKIAENLLGSLDFAPIVRKTPSIIGYEKKQMGKMAYDLAKQYDPSTLARAMRYLYTKETMSSWEIEKEKPDNAKLARFVQILHKADSIGILSEEMLIELQKNIVDPRFALNSYRNFQNYVGEEPGMGKLIIHYIPPNPEDVSSLMKNLIESFNVMEKSAINPIIAAAILSFGFVFIHPFEDGNGRIHRFLIHYALARLKFTPEGIVFPISACIVRDMRNYDKTLETFSKPLMQLITNFKVNDIGEMKVSQDTADFYRYIDFTPFAEYLYECVDKTITTDFHDELSFLASYDKIKLHCKAIVDLPDQRLDLFIKCVRQNGGALSAKKRESYFEMLSDEEINKMEEVINKYSKIESK
ncbi:MAG: Fic family protein [Chlamydiae bacterium]|nr:Fic family protein [Chlamydiota bacterium]